MQNPAMLDALIGVYEETSLDIQAQQFFHIHRHSAASLHICSSLIWNLTENL